MKINKKLFFLGLFALFFISCRLSYKNIEFQRAQNSLKKKNFHEALMHYSRVIKRSPESPISLEAAREAARISLFETQQFSRAIDFFHHLVVYSVDEVERRRAQEAIAFIYFEKLNDYQAAIKEYSRLLVLPITESKKIEFKLAIAKSYFYLNKFNQAIIEINDLLKFELPRDKAFTINHFKASILLTKKEIEPAIQVYRQLLAEYPELSKKEKVGISIAVAYEDMNALDKAISILEEIRPSYDDADFIDIKIKRLKERIANLPGVRRKF